MLAAGWACHGAVGEQRPDSNRGRCKAIQLLNNRWGPRSTKRISRFHRTQIHACTRLGKRRSISRATDASGSEHFPAVAAVQTRDERSHWLVRAPVSMVQTITTKM